MRWIVLFFAVAVPLILFAEDSPMDTLPQAVRETLEMEKGDGIVTSAESYTWGDATIYKVQIDIAGAPALELQIAANGKLIRVDDLRPVREDDDGDDMAD